MLRTMSSLAINGGEPVRRTMLPYGRQWVDADDVAAVVESLQSDWLTTGPRVVAFEEAFAAKVGAAHAVAVSSGTAALHAAAFAAGIGPGDEVIVPPLTFAASANCVRYQGGTVVFADVRPDTLTLDPTLVERAITSKTRAIVTVDYAGQPSDLDELLALAARHKLLVIEDACHALGATYREKAVGGLAHLTAFSLHPVKHITAGEGGVVSTNDPSLAQRVRMFRNHGIASDHRQREAEGSWMYEMSALGWNYRLTDFQCALAQSQLRKLSAWMARRREIAAAYSTALASCPAVETPFVVADRDSAWHLYTIRLHLGRLRVGRADVFRALRAENIGVNVHYIPVPWHPYYRNLGYERGLWPIAEHAYERLISIPLFPAMTDDDVEDVVRAVCKVARGYAR